MTFLNPFVLFGLAAAAIPILIHLLNKRKLRTIDFSTLSFLKELQKNTMRKITIRQWLLLLLRTFLIAALVLAFSRPTIKGSFGTIGSHASTTIAIIIDNTSSMNLHNEKGTYIDQAKEQARSIVSMMEENDDAFIIRLSDLPGLTMENPSHDRLRLQSVITETKTEPQHRTIIDAMRAAAAALQRSRNVNKEIYVLSDGQYTTMTSRQAETGTAEKLFAPETKVFYARYADSPAENIGIERVSIPPTLLQTNKPVTINAVVKNYGTASVTNHLVSMTIGKNRVMQKSVTLDGGESATVDFTATPNRAGFMTGSIELEDDSFEADNQYFFSLYIPEKIRVALVTTDIAYSRYIVTALNVANTTTASGSVSLQLLTPTQISTSILDANDVVILSGVPEIQESSVRLVHQFVAGGGAMVFFPSHDTTGATYRYLERFGITISGVRRAAPGTVVRFENVDFDFPIFHGMFDDGAKKNTSLESPDITMVASVQPDRNLRQIITLTNGIPFLWLRNIQHGTVAGFSVPATMQWSDMVFRGIFVPIVYQTMLYLTSQMNSGMQFSNSTVGEQLEFTSAEFRRTMPVTGSSLRLFDPEQRNSPLQSYSRAVSDGISHAVFAVTGIHSAGHYFVVAERDTILAISANTNRTESDGATATETEIEESFRTVGIDELSVTYINSQMPMNEIVMQSRFGVELWKYFVLLAAVLGLIEMLVARERSEQ
jgi:hypothetical protein